MPKGLRVPLGVSPKGGGAMVEFSENDNKIVALALGDDTNDNAFQQNIGLGPSIIFDINDDTLKARLMQRMRLIFDRFKVQRRYELVSDSVKWIGPDEGAEEGSLILEFKYFSLEANEERLFRRPYRSGGGVV